MSNVIPGNFRTRLDINPDDVLEGAKGHVDKVLILGTCEEGNYVAASTGDKGTLLFMIELFKTKLLNGDFDE